VGVSVIRRREEKGVLDTKRQLLVEVVFLLARVGECNLVKCDDRRWELAYVFKIESVWHDKIVNGYVKNDGYRKRFSMLDLLDEACSFHLVDDLLFGLGLAVEIGVHSS